MERFVEALSISVISLIIAFSVLILIMLLMYALAATVGRTKPGAPATSSLGGQSRTAVAPTSVSSDTADQTEVAVIMAALQAAEVDIPSGGRVRIEKVSRRG